MDNDKFLDIEIHDLHHRTHLLPQTALRLSDRIKVSSIPFHLIAGAPLDVYSNNEKTREWLLELLSYTEDGQLGCDTVHEASDSWKISATQSDIGYLVEICQEEPVKNLRRLTEILIYATTLERAFDSISLPTPPPSSPSSRDASEYRASDQFHDPQTIAFRALPLCSNTHRMARSNVVDRVRKEQPGPAFINLELCDRDIIASDGKRRELNSLFDNASLQRKRLKKSGGDAVGQLISGQHGKLASSKIIEQSNKSTTAIDQLNVVSDAAHRTRKQRLPRSLSTVSAPCGSPPGPSNKQAVAARSDRSELQEVRDMVLLPMAVLTTRTMAIEQQNKASISRIIMAGMRLHGIQQPKRGIQRTASLHDDDRASSSGAHESPDEFKLIYHQSYKAAAFAFRRQICTQILAPEDLRDTIDRLLTIFCSDPSNTGLGNGRAYNRFDIDCVESPDAFDTTFCAENMELLTEKAK